MKRTSDVIEETLNKSTHLSGSEAQIRTQLRSMKAQNLMNNRFNKTTPAYTTPHLPLINEIKMTPDMEEDYENGVDYNLLKKIAKSPHTPILPPISAQSSLSTPFGSYDENWFENVESNRCRYLNNILLNLEMQLK